MKKLILTLIAMVMMTAFATGVNALDSAFYSATVMQFDSRHYDSISENNPIDYYTFALSESGKVSLNITSYISCYSAAVCDENGDTIWKSEENQYVSTTGRRTDTHELDLKTGIYYLKVSGYYRWYGNWSVHSGNYDFSLSFTSAKENVSEPNDSIVQAKSIACKKTYYGQIAINDADDYYEVNLTASGNLAINMTSYLEQYSIYLYDYDGNQLWESINHEWISTTGKRTDAHSIDLEKGIYYLCISGRDHYDYSTLATGNYKFKLTFTDAKVNVAEPNNSIPQAKTILLGKNYRGIISLVSDYYSSDEDYYKVTVKKNLTLQMTVKSYMDYYSLHIYNDNGTEVWKATYNERSEGSAYRSDTWTASLTPGVYYLKINGLGYKGLSRMKSTGNYTFKLQYSIPKTTGLKATSKKTSVTLQWNKVSGATGYRVYQYNSSSKKYELIQTVTTNKATVKDLKAGTKYRFKVRAYIKENSVNMFGKYSSVLATATKTATPKITSCTVKNGKVTLKWSSVSGESGYQIYYSTKKDSGYQKYSNYKANTTKGSVSGLKKGKTYYFKVRTYIKTDSGNVYSSWSEPYRISLPSSN